MLSIKRREKNCSKLVSKFSAITTIIDHNFKAQELFRLINHKHLQYEWNVSFLVNYDRFFCISLYFQQVCFSVLRKYNHYYIRWSYRKLITLEAHNYLRNHLFLISFASFVVIDIWIIMHHSFFFSRETQANKNNLSE